MEKLENLINAAEQGSAEAMYELGMIYYSGDGVAEDERLAYKWLRRAAAKGDHIAEELYRQLSADRKEIYLIKLLGKDYIAKYGKAVVLHCPVCSRVSVPLIVPSNANFRWVRLAAYSCADWVDKERLNFGMYKVGKKLKICMYYPFYCKIGDTFSVTFGDSYSPNSRFITCQLLGIIKLEKSYAKVSVRVISEGTYLSFVRNVDNVKKVKEQAYNYIAPDGDSVLAHYDYVSDNIINFRNSFGGGDMTQSDYIFTDSDGIDHLVQSCYGGIDEDTVYFGDKMLGLHEYSPYFPPPHTLSNGSIVQGVPRVFLDSLKRRAEKDGIVPWLQNMANDIKGGRYSGDIRDGLYTKVIVPWIGKISVEGFLCAVRTVIEEVADSEEEMVNDEIKQLYNGIVADMISRSYVPISLDTFQF